MTSSQSINAFASTSTSTSTIWQRLVTNEDPFHCHKTLGLLCLASYLWRFPLAGAADMGFRSHPSWTLPTLALHFSLNATSFLFHIPAQRIKAGGYRIWPEYRWHSFIFLCRSLLYMVIVWYREQQENNNEKSDFQYHLAHYFLVLLSCGAADLASHSQVIAKSPTIRGLDAPRGVKYFFSSAQLLATTSVLYGLPRYSTQFVFCWIVQGNAFLMTLRRKNAGSQRVLVSIYGLTIVVGMNITNFDQIYYSGDKLPYFTMLGMTILAQTAVLLRLGPRWILPQPIQIIQNNKYCMWTALFIFSQYVRRWVQLMMVDDDRAFWAILGGAMYSGITLLAAVVWGFYKPYPVDGSKYNGDKDKLNKVKAN